MHEGGDTEDSEAYDEEDNDSPDDIKPGGARPHGFVILLLDFNHFDIFCICDFVLLWLLHDLSLFLLIALRMITLFDEQRTVANVRFSCAVFYEQLACYRL